MNTDESIEIRTQKNELKFANNISPDDINLVSNKILNVQCNRTSKEIICSRVPDVKTNGTKALSDPFESNSRIHNLLYERL